MDKKDKFSALRDLLNERVVPLGNMATTKERQTHYEQAVAKMMAFLSTATPDMVKQLLTAYDELVLEKRQQANIQQQVREIPPALKEIANWHHAESTNSQHAADTTAFDKPEKIAPLLQRRANVHREYAETILATVCAFEELKLMALAPLSDEHAQPDEDLLRSSENTRKALSKARDEVATVDAALYREAGRAIVAIDLLVQELRKRK